MKRKKTNGKKLVLVASHVQITCASMKAWIVNFLSEYVDVITWCLGDSAEPPKDIEHVDLSLAVTRQVYEMCRIRCPPDKPLLSAERVISVQWLDKLLNLGDSARAYVCGTNYETTTNTITLLRGLGFTQTFLPCYIAMPDPVDTSVTVAITPALPQLVPPHITNIIDVGAKEVAISTLAEMMRLLDIPVTVLNNISNFYIKTLLSHTRERSVIGTQNEVLKNQLEAILDTLQEAIVALDENRKVVVYNLASEKIFSVPVDKAIGCDWLDIMPESILVDCMEGGESVSRVIKYIDGQHYLVNTNVITGTGKVSKGVVATFHPVREIRELDTQVRRELKGRANVARYFFKDIRGTSPELRRAVSLARKFATTELTILLEGESGTGKELFAQAIHNQSPRRNEPFVAINFAAIPDNLIESELFGYEEGAFTGARKGGKPGLFEEAHLGTIFLDEIGSATPDVQNRLLRVLEEQEIRRLGSSRNTPVDVRVIAATNIDLEELVSRRVFRDDLYYRLCTLPIFIPPLRSRREDIAMLAGYFAEKQPGVFVFSPELMDTFLLYDWPGNIRELQNVIKYLCSVVEQGEPASVETLPPYLLRKLNVSGPVETRPAPQEPEVAKIMPAILGDMRKPDTRRVVYALLTEISNHSAQFKGVGYSRLYRSIHAFMPEISEYYIKKWLRSLKDMGYVETGRTRQGTLITDKGVILLKTLQKSDNPPL